MNRTVFSITGRKQRGLSLIEACITLLVATVSLGAAVPSLQQAREKRHLDGVAAQLGTDIRHARSAAVARQEQVRLSFHRSATGNCYIVHTGTAADCSCAPSGAASCSNGAQALQSAAFAGTAPVQVTANVGSMLFDADRGTVTPAGTVRVQAASGLAVHQVVSIMGRTRACSPSGAQMGYPAC